MKQLGIILSAAIGIIIPVLLGAQTGPPVSAVNASSTSMVTHSPPVQQTEPQRTILQSDASSITIKYQFNGYDIATKTESGMEYQFLQQ